MIFIKNGLEYPRYVGDIEQENPEWELGQALPEGWEFVQETAAPTPTTDQLVTEVFPVLVEGQWTQTWELIDLTEEDINKLILAEFKRQTEKPERAIG